MAEQNRKRTFLQPPAFGIPWQMSDSAPAPNYSLAFDPVPSASRRHDGWTPERQRRFIAALQEIGMVSAAAAAVGMSRKSAYALLKRAGPDSSFARAWAEAQAAGRTNAWLTGVDRAINGVEVPYFYRGIQRGTRRIYNDRLLAAALRAMERVQGGR
jgi:hypothetical protein